MRRGFRMSPKSKYGSSKTKIDGHTFDSMYEGQRYLLLKDRLKKGEISRLKLQVGFRIIKKVVKTVPEQLKTKIRYKQVVVEKEAKYHCDFMYVENGKMIVEEFKSEMTAELADYILRRKLMVNKIYDHNEKGHGITWVFREVVYNKKGKITITDK